MSTSSTRRHKHRKWAVLSGPVMHGATITEIVYRAPGDVPGDSGFQMFSDDDPKGPQPELGDAALVCLHCVIDQRPQVGTGMEVAREHGTAHLIEGEWRAEA